MRQSAYEVGYGRLAFGVLGAVCAALALGACSSTSRFDTLGYGASQSSDLSTTAALPIPQESVYASGAAPAYAGTAGMSAPRYYGDQNGQLARSSLPPAQDYSAPRAMPAAYTPPEPPARQANRRAPQAAPAIYGGASPSSGFKVKAAQGDTLSVLSRRYGVPVEQIQAANNLPDGRLRVGQELIIPTARKQPTPVAAEPKQQVAAATPKAMTDANPAVRMVKTTSIPAPGAPTAEADTTPDETTNGVKASNDITGEPKTRVAHIGQLPSPEPMSGNSFRWPVKGRVIAGFGPKPDGGHNDGINLAVPQGTTVKAAENGVVAYAGNELKGYGNLVLVRHANNWVSAYAHNDEILVKRGDQVRRGQVIAKAGATGSVSSPQVHFELRKGSRPVDPTKYMADATASSD